MASNSFWRCCTLLLSGLLVAQWIMFSFVLSHRHPENQPLSSTPHQRAPVTTPSLITSPLPGVAATLMLKAPKWFHRRYTVMLHNALANIPPDWKVQVIVNEAWFRKDVLPFHPALNSTYGRIIWSPIPPSMTKLKPKQIYKSTWFWETVAAENVLLFGGNGAMCANTHFRFQDWLHYDYIGTPWKHDYGRGGDGSTHSFRHRSAMLAILEKHPVALEDDQLDYYYFLDHLSKDGYTVADKAATVAFGGIQEEPDVAPFLVSGTLGNVDWSTRDQFLSVCPELKTIFPSMHEPACFGAHPNPEKCRQSICALQEKIPPQGC
eukprot:Nitzschia sp. Nitz4//scaffold45_size130396//21794//22756//NITZ4_003433-RA/size130396-processed-gene-0.68-mRNA-1//1//CDS//3329552350//8148//frame0